MRALMPCRACHAGRAAAAVALGPCGSPPPCPIVSCQSILTEKYVVASTAALCSRDVERAGRCGQWSTWCSVRKCCGAYRMLNILCFSDAGAHQIRFASSGPLTALMDAANSLLTR